MLPARKSSGSFYCKPQPRLLSHILALSNHPPVRKVHLAVSSQNLYGPTKLILSLPKLPLAIAFFASSDGGALYQLLRLESN